MRRLPAILALVACACSAQTLLFKSGYESSTVLSAIPSTANGPNSVTQNFSGADSSTSYAWPMTIFGWSPSVLTYDGLHVEPPGGDTSPLNSHWFNRLETVTGHTGASTTALHLEWEGYTESCCQQTVFQTSTMNPPLKKVYYRFWMKYPSYLATWLANNTSTYIGQTMMSYKTSSDYRIHLNNELNGDYHNLHPKMTADALGQTGNENYLDPITGSITQSTNATNPREFLEVVNQNIILPVGSWFLVEVSFNRSLGNDGYYDTAINGQTVGHTFGSNYGALNQEIQDMYWLSLYFYQPPPTPTSSAGAMEEIDDFEVWDSPPCGTFPCGSGATTTWTGTAAPFVTSPQGAVGVVGQPFRYQTVATNSPTSYSTQESLPPGLSLNSSTGLVSGTPTASGTYSGIYIKAQSSVGYGSQWTEFQINPATPSSPPTIPSFSANPMNIAAGGWSRLQWAQSGAAILSINGTDVTGRDPFPVNPSATTIYKLTATNSAGSTSATATVNVTGSAGLPTISSFAASPSSIFPGGSSVLGWATSGATSVSIDQGVGTVTGTSVSVSPTASTTYTLTAANASGSVTRSVMVSVGAPSISSFIANPNTMSSPGSCTLSWVVSGSSSLSVDKGVGPVTGNSVLVTPTATTTYTLTATNSVGSTIAQATITVGVVTSVSGASIIIE